MRSADEIIRRIELWKRLYIRLYKDRWAGAPEDIVRELGFNPYEFTLCSDPYYDIEVISWIIRELKWVLGG